MPFVTFTTNVPEDKLGQNFNQKLNKGLAEAIPEKPYELFAIHVISTDKFTFGGTNEPAAMIQVSFKCNVTKSKLFLDHSIWHLYSSKLQKIFQIHWRVFAKGSWVVSNSSSHPIR